MLSGLKMGNRRYQELWSPSGGGARHVLDSRVWSKNPGCVPGLLVTQSKIVLHFISKRVPLEGSSVFERGVRLLLSSRLAVKKSSGMLALVGVRPLGEPVIPRVVS